MKRPLQLLFLAVLLFTIPAHAANNNDYVIVGWNDLGMHCINPSYAELALLPPFNNLWAQVIQRGDPPKIVTSGITLEYSIQNNTTVNGKTDFWTYAASLFASLMNLQKPSNGVGLTGNGLSGKMQLVGDHFEATGIPVLPYDDEMNWNPFQIATVTLRDNPGKGNKIGQTIQVVLPVSDEIHCDMCHMQGGDGTQNLPPDPMTGLTGTMDVFLNILMVHDFYNTSSQLAKAPKPVICAGCHASNALGVGAHGASTSVSLAMHSWHNGEDRCTDPTFSCYSCHPGELTQCLRTGIQGMGYLGTTPSCSDQRDANGNLIAGMCHGGIKGVAKSITDSGRRPWLDEPDAKGSNCALCHGSNYSTGGQLYRRATGHGGIYCAACHNSPHAWWPSKLWADNLQPAKLQRAPYSIGKCGVCHTNNLAGDNPHVTYYR